MDGDQRQELVCFLPSCLHNTVATGTVFITQANIIRLDKGVVGRLSVVDIAKYRRAWLGRTNAYGQPNRWSKAFFLYVYLFKDHYLGNGVPRYRPLRFHRKVVLKARGNDRHTPPQINRKPRHVWDGVTLGLSLFLYESHK